jgi:hypothetical protein
VGFEFWIEMSSVSDEFFLKKEIYCYSSLYIKKMHIAID